MAAAKQVGGSRQSGVKKPAPVKKAAVKKAVPVPKPVAQSTPAIAPADIAAGKQAIAKAKATPKKTVDPNLGTQTTTTANAANPNLLPGAVDPFAGTPYAGMSPYQVAQKIVQDEIDAQTKSINAQRDAQVQANTNALSILSQLGQQLQQGAGQFATNYNNALGGGQGGAGADQGVGSTKFQGFNAGYQAAQGLIGGSNPNQAGGPSQAAPLNPEVTGGGAQNYQDTAQATNPFAVLPSAYGRIAQMDATTLAANQASSLTAYSQAVQDLYAHANKDIFDEFNSIKAEFDAANGAVTSAQADQAAAQSKAASDRENTYRWQYSKQASEAARETVATGLYHYVDPKTLRIVNSGVRTIAGLKAGVVLNKPKPGPKPNATFTKANGYVSDASGKPILVNGQKVRVQGPAEKKSSIKPAPTSIQSQYPYLVGYDSNGNIVALKGPNGNPVPYKPKATKGAMGSQSSTVPGTPGFNAKVHTAIGKTVSTASGAASAMAGQTIKTGAKVNPDGTVVAAGTKPKYTRQQIWKAIYLRYSRSLFTYYRQLGYKHPQDLVNKAITQAVNSAGV